MNNRIKNRIKTALHTVHQPAEQLMTASPGFFQWSRGSMRPDPEWPRGNVVHIELPPVKSKELPVPDPVQCGIIRYYYLFHK